MPEWMGGYLQENVKEFRTVEDKMGFVLELATQNILRKTGGPFSAAIFNSDTNQLISAAVNRAIP